MESKNNSAARAPVVSALKAHLALNVKNVAQNIQFYRQLFDTEPSKVDALRDVLYVECQMGLQGRNHRRSGGRIVLAFHREPPLESYSPKRMRPHGRQSQYIC